jgi:ribosomal protein L37AE/L43A
MTMRICPNCGKKNYSADDSNTWNCHTCEAEIPKSQEKPITD